MNRLGHREIKMYVSIVKKVFFNNLISFFINNNSSAEYVIDYYRWLLDNNQTSILDKEKLKRWLLDSKKLERDLNGALIQALKDYITKFFILISNMIIGINI